MKTHDILHVRVFLHALSNGNGLGAQGGLKWRFNNDLNKNRAIVVYAVYGAADGCSEFYGANLLILRVEMVSEIDRVENGSQPVSTPVSQAHLFWSWTKVKSPTHPGYALQLLIQVK